MAEELLFQSRGCRGQPRFLLRATGQMRNEAPRVLGFQCKEQAQVKGLDQRWLCGAFGSRISEISDKSLCKAPTELKRCAPGQGTKESLSKVSICPGHWKACHSHPHTPTPPVRGELLKIAVKASGCVQVSLPELQPARESSPEPPPSEGAWGEEAGSRGLGYTLELLDKSEITQQLVGWSLGSPATKELHSGNEGARGTDRLGAVLTPSTFSGP